jgi:hypothetical protein
VSVCVKFSVGASGSAGGRLLYDTKERATEGRNERVWTKNVPAYVEGKEQEISPEKEVPTPDVGRPVRSRVREMSYKERRANLAEYARQRDEDERARGHEGKGETRTYYRAIYSFHEDPGDEKVRKMVDEHQEERFSKCSIINSLHRNAGHVHVHTIIFARQTDDRKLQLGWKSYREIDDSWAKIYGCEFGEHFTREHLEKKRERREHRVAAREAKAKGQSVPERPRRVSHERNQVQERIRTSNREHGVELYEQARTGGDQRQSSGGDRGSPAGVVERSAREVGGREQPVAGRDGRAPGATGGLGESARKPARDGDRVPAAEGERTGGTRRGTPAVERPAPDRIESSGRGGEQTRRRVGSIGGRARDDAGGSRAGEERGAGGTHVGRGLEASIHGDVRPHDQGDGRETDGRRAVAAPGTGDHTTRHTSPTPARDGHARGVDTVPGTTVEQRGDALGNILGLHDADLSVLRSEMDLELDVALMPLREQKEREEKGRAPNLGSSPGTQIPTLEPEHVPEVERDFSFDR